MNHLQQTFNDNVREVTAYFRFLGQVLESDAQIFRPLRPTHKYRTIPTETQKMLKAASLMVLYNLAESTIRCAVSAIYEAVAVDGLTYGEAGDKIRDVWLHYKTADLSKGPSGIDTIRRSARGIVDEVVSGLVIDVNREYLPGSGNIDAKRIKKLADTFGFSKAIRFGDRKTASLEFVRVKRNHLAHGVFTFGDCGGNLELSELLKYKKEVISYLGSFLRNVEKYIENKHYRLRTA